MNIPVYHIDAFTGRIFSGNPAAVCPLQKWPNDFLLQAIAAENNLSETAFYVPDGKGYHIRWFTPLAEVDLCGHATLAAAFVIMNEIHPAKRKITFHSRSGELTVVKMRNLLAMDFPARPPQPSEDMDEVADALRQRPAEIFRSDDYLAVFETEEEIRRLSPDVEKLTHLEGRGVIVTAPGSGAVDFVSRFFAPKLGIDEDPVTGSAHCALVPYWSQRLKKQKLHAQQLSRRGGELFCRHHGPRVTIAGRAARFMKGKIAI